MRFVVLNEKTNTATTKQRLIYFSAIEGSLNKDTLCHEIYVALNGRRLRVADVAASMTDGCSVNIAAHEKINQTCITGKIIAWLEALCLSHCLSNAEKEANFLRY